MSATLLEVVEHYQKKVEKYSDEDKILHCFDKLQRLPITLQVLSQTGVGKTVNAFRRDPGPVGTRSRALVTKWKRIFEENEQAEQRNGERCRGRSRERSDERSDERSPSPTGSDGSERMQIDEARALEEQREAAEAAEAAEAERRREAAAEAERRARDEEKRRRREERARRESDDQSTAQKRRGGDDSTPDRRHSKHKQSHRKESKHRRHGEPVVDGHDEPTPAAASARGSDRTASDADEGHRGSRERDKRHQDKDRHDKHKSRHSSDAKHSSPSDSKHSSSNGTKHPSSSSSGHGASKERAHHSSKNDATPSKPSSKHKTNGAADAPKRSSKHADAADGDASREARRAKHKAAKHERRRSAETAAAKPQPTLKEVDFCVSRVSVTTMKVPASHSLPHWVSTADAGRRSGEPESAPRKKKKKSKSSSSSSSSRLSTSAPQSSADVRLPERVAPPSPPPPLEALDVLPEISAHYRPLPRAPAAARSTVKRAADEEEALAAVLSAKNKRTKVYSGSRSTGWSRVPTLIDICLRSLQENVDYLEYTGGVPFDILRPVLEKCSAGQLHNIEYYNSYLLDDTDSLWQSLVKKEFKSDRREEMETWREMYLRCSEERELKYNKLRSMIEGKRKESLASSRKTKVAFEHTVAKPPRNVARKQARHGTAIAMSNPAPTSQGVGGVRPPRPPAGTDPTSRAAAPARSVAPQKKKAPLMAKVLRAMGRR